MSRSPFQPNSFPWHHNRWLKPFIISLILVLPAALIMSNPNLIGAFAQSRAPSTIGKTLAFDEGRVVTLQYSQIYFCNSPGPLTGPTSSPCKVGADAAVDPVPDAASNILNVIVPSFLGTDNLKPSNPSNTIAGEPGSKSIFDPLLGANNFSQCPDTTASLGCPNHPNFLDLAPASGSASQLVVPLPIHSHIISGNGAHGAQGGWWKLIDWSVNANGANLWPNPKTGECIAGTGCLTSEAALTHAAALPTHPVTGPILTTIYLFFNVVS
jgi:hypothetical protein